MHLSRGKWTEWLNYHQGRLRIECIEVVGGVAQRRPAFVSVLTAFSQGMEVDESAVLITDACALVAEHTHEQHQRNDGERMILETTCSDWSSTSKTTLLCQTQ